MDPEYGLTCSSINLRMEPRLTSSVLHGLGPQEPVRILAEFDDILQVEAYRWQPPLTGYAPRASILRPRPHPLIFPQVDLGGDFEIPSVPLSLPLSVFLRWLGSHDESPWLPASYLEAIRSGRVPSVGGMIRRAIADRRSIWDEWVAEVRADGREDSCTLDEWNAWLDGGREMWSIRAERIFAAPSEHGTALGWVSPDDVVHWTGHVRFSPEEPKYNTWYEVEFMKLDRRFKGWYKASLLEEFILPTPKTDLNVPQNRDTAFDLSRPRLHLPADPEIEDARKAGRVAAQYIDIRRALGWGLLHHNLCGEFCVAALAALGVIPLLQEWLPGYLPAREILEKDRGTGISDLESMLDAVGLKYEFYRAEGSVAPLTPSYLRRMLDTGRMAIAATGVTTYGQLKAHSRIRHWVVIEDILRVGNSGWLRVYNPFSNREEVYRFEEVIDMPSRSSIGLWTEPRPAALKSYVPRGVTSVHLDPQLQSQPVG